MKILVIGATGMLGEPVARQLQADGHTIRILSRNVEKAQEKFPHPFEVVYGDVEEPETLRKALAGCAGVHINLAGGPTPDDYDRIEHRGTANVAQMAAVLGLERISYLSGYSVNESDGAKNYATNAKFLAETAVKASGVPYTIFRAAWFMESLPLFIQNKRAMMVGKQEIPLHWVAAQDYALMVSKSYQIPEAMNKIFYIYGPEGISMTDAVKFYQATVRSDVPFTRIPTWLLAIIASLTRDATLKDMATFMKYMEKAQEMGSGAEANALLGKPTITLSAWCQAQLNENNKTSTAINLVDRGTAGQVVVGEGA